MRVGSNDHARLSDARYHVWSLDHHNNIIDLSRKFPSCIASIVGPFRARYRRVRDLVLLNTDEDSAVMMNFPGMHRNKRTVNFFSHSTSSWDPERRRSGRIMASCATPRVPKSKGDAERAGGALARSPFSAFTSAFLVFLSFWKKLLYGGKARVLCRGGRKGWKGSETANHPGSLRWLLSVDNAPIRRCVPRNAIPFTQRNPKLCEIPGFVARPHRMRGVTHLGVGCAPISAGNIYTIVLWVCVKLLLLLYSV